MSVREDEADSVRVGVASSANEEVGIVKSVDEGGADSGKEGVTNVSGVGVVSFTSVSLQVCEIG